MKRRRRFYNGIINHVYQRTVGGVHLFYTIEDCLVFLSILSVCVRSSNVRVLELCLMHNHFHMLIIADSFEDLSSFMQRLTSWYAISYNSEHGRKGRLFKKNFGSANMRSAGAWCDWMRYKCRGKQQMENETVHERASNVAICRPRNRGKLHGL